jgi:two-component system, chemotaxis family, sensor kinase CheA
MGMTSRQFDTLRDLIYKSLGLHFEDAKLDFMDKRVEKRMVLEEGMKLVGELEASVGPRTVLGAAPPPLPVRMAIAAVDVVEIDLWAIHFAPEPRIFYSGNDPLALLRELLALGHGVARVDATRLFGEDVEFDPELCYLSWDVQLAARVTREAIREVFQFVEDESDLRIEQVKAESAWVLPAEAYFDPATVKECRDEVAEDIAEVETHTLALEGSPFERDHLAALKRALHNLKGVSRLVLSDVRRAPPARHPLRAMGELCHAAESFLEGFAGEATGPLDERVPEVMLETSDWLKALLRSFDAGTDAWPGELLVRLGATAVEPGVLVAPVSKRDAMLRAVVDQCEQVMHAVEVRRLPDEPPSPADWQTLARALGTVGKATAFEGGGRGSGEVQALVAICEASVRGAGEGSWGAFRERCHAALGLVAGPPEAHAPSLVPSARPKGRTISLRPSRPPAQAPRAGAPPAQAAAAAAAPPRSVRVDQAKLDVLMGAIGELLVAKNALPVLVARVWTDRQAKKEISETVARIAHVADDLQNAMRQIRMMPIRSAFQRFPRLIRDLARSENKQVQLIISGDETELDKTVLEQIGDPLVHLIRNAVDHGIELPERRLAQGKPEMGTIGLEVLKEGSSVIIRISDDGRGMDPKRLRAKALEKNLFSEAELAAMPDARVLDLIFLPGFSTAEKVTDVSGRGVGMDVVQSNIHQLRGTVTVASDLGRGSVMSIKLPSSLMVSKGMLIECSAEQYVLPIEGVREMVRIRRDQVRHFNGVAMTNVRGSVCPVFSLARLLGLEATTEGGLVMTSEESNAAIVFTRVGEVAVLVDRLVAEIDVIVKPLSEGLDKLTMFQGATILGDGSVALILDIGKLDALIDLNAPSDPSVQ